MSHEWLRLLASTTIHSTRPQRVLWNEAKPPSNALEKYDVEGVITVDNRVRSSAEQLCNETKLRSNLPLLYSLTRAFLNGYRITSLEVSAGRLLRGCVCDLLS